MLKEAKPTGLEERILVCVGDRGSAEEVLSVLSRNGFEVEICSDLSRFGEKMAEGAGAAYLSEEIVRNGNLPILTRCLAEQAAWSDLPLIMASRGGDKLQDSLQAFSSIRSGGNIMLIDCPVRAVNLCNAVQVALRARRRQYDVRDLIEQREAILASISDPFMILDRNFRFLYVNESAASLRGYSVADFIGKSKWDFFPESIGTPYYHALQDAVEKNETRRIEHFDSFARRWYEKRVYPSRDGFSILSSDITERKNAEEALRESEEKFRLMVESALEYAIFSFDRAGCITSWNTGAERLLGYSEEEIIGQAFEIIFTPEDRKREKPARELIEAEVTGQGDDERWHLRKDGSRFWASGRVMPMLDPEGKTGGYVKILRDYTGHKRAETWLRALNETLEKRVEDRTAEAEHRATQLQMLAGQLTEAEERERRRLAELLHDHLQQILVAAKMQVGVLSHRPLEQVVADGLQRVDNLLERSIEASRSLTVELSPPILYDAGLGPALLWLGRRMLEDHGLNVLVNGEEDPGPDSENLRGFLFQAVRELLFNIVKHAGVDQAQVDLSRTEGQVEVRVRDGGIGFDSEQQVAIQTKGSGFGLFSIAERIELLGGSIRIETTPGVGTNVWVRVPERAVEVTGKGLREHALPFESVVRNAGGETLSLSESGNERIRILLADDHKILREGLAGLLRDQPDFEVVSEASDGQMAVELARETEPDVIIMDVTMPRLNGVEATRIITGEMPQIRVIGLSMHAREDMAEAMRKAGAVGYVTKGAPSEILTAAIREAAVSKIRISSPVK